MSHKDLLTALELIRDIAVGYDGCGNNVEALKDLIDELREIAEKALKGECPKFIKI